MSKKKTAKAHTDDEEGWDVHQAVIEMLSGEAASSSTSSSTIKTEPPLIQGAITIRYAIVGDRGEGETFIWTVGELPTETAAVGEIQSPTLIQFLHQVDGNIRQGAFQAALEKQLVNFLRDTLLGLTGFEERQGVQPIRWTGREPLSLTGLRGRSPDAGRFLARLRQVKRQIENSMGIPTLESVAENWGNEGISPRALSALCKRYCLSEDKQHFRNALKKCELSD